MSSSLHFCCCCCLRWWLYTLLLVQLSLHRLPLVLDFFFRVLFFHHQWQVQQENDDSKTIFKKPASRQNICKISSSKPEHFVRLYNARRLDVQFVHTFFCLSVFFRGNCSTEHSFIGFVEVFMCTFAISCFQAGLNVFLLCECMCVCVCVVVFQKLFSVNSRQIISTLGKGRLPRRRQSVGKI